MATGVPKKDLTLSKTNVRLEYEGKGSSQNILDRHSQRFDIAHNGSTGKRLYFGDNIDVLSNLINDPSICGKVTLIYIDPPFSTQSKFLSRKQNKAYSDTLTGGHFIEFLRERLILLHKLLADHGSIYLHLDEKMVFEMKLVMDEIFGPSNYRNMIIRKKCNSKNYTRKAYGNIADFILFYTKTDKYIWNRPVEPLSEQSKKEYQYIEPETGRQFMKVPVHAPGTRNGETGKPWRGKMPPLGKHWQYTPKTLDEMDARGEIFWSKNGNPRRKIYLDKHPGAGVQDIWLDYKDAHNQNIKITGYPTEKNPDLIRRIIAASSNPGDIVLDCFAGSGTTLSLAEEMQRNWIGADNSIEALKTILKRFERGLKAMGDFVQTKPAIKLSDPKSQTLFDSLEADTGTHYASTKSTHTPISNFTVLVPRKHLNNEQAVVEDWKRRNNLLTSEIWKTPSIVSEKSNYAEICYHLHTKDKKLGKIIDRIGLCELTNGHVGFDFLVDAIISQQLSKKAADTIAQRFRQLFPKGKQTPKAFLKKSENDFRKAGISHRKYSYISDLCKHVVQGNLSLIDLEDSDDDTVRNALKKVKGIGDWTVDMYLLFGLGRPDIFPIHDLALRKIMNKVYKVPLDDFSQLAKISSKWQPYRSVGSWYLYKFANENA